MVPAFARAQRNFKPGDFRCQSGGDSASLRAPIKEPRSADPLIMGTATTVIGILPTYETLGIWAAILLIACRLGFRGRSAHAVHHSDRADDAAAQLQSSFPRAECCSDGADRDRRDAPHFPKAARALTTYERA
jgi:hypothetical protein